MAKGSKENSSKLRFKVRSLPSKRRADVIGPKFGEIEHLSDEFDGVLLNSRYGDDEIVDDMETNSEGKGVEMLHGELRDHGNDGYSENSERTAAQMDKLTEPVHDQAELYGDMNTPPDQVDSSTMKPKKTTSHIRTHTKDSTAAKKRKYHEFGTDINGYKFVKHRDDKTELNDDITRHSVFVSDSYKISYEPAPLVVRKDKYAAKQKTERQFKEYLKEWDSRIQSRDEIPWPHIENKYSLITIDSLKNFYPNDSKIWKAERIKWHPDNFVKRYQFDEITMNKVKSVFQMINEVWEKEYA